MITVTLTVQLTEMQARDMWDSEDAPHDADTPPAGQQLADEIANSARATLMSNWQFDNGFSPAVTTTAKTETLALLRRLKAIDDFIATADAEAPEIGPMLEHGEAIAFQLTGSTEPEEHAHQLTLLREAYAAELPNPAPQTDAAQ